MRGRRSLPRLKKPQRARKSRRSRLAGKGLWGSLLREDEVEKEAFMRKVKISERDGVRLGLERAAEPAL
jgi:hypothetical protein